MHEARLFLLIIIMLAIFFSLYNNHVYADHVEASLGMYKAVVNKDNVEYKYYSNYYKDDGNENKKEDKILNSGDIVYVYMEDLQWDIWEKPDEKIEIVWAALEPNTFIFDDYVDPGLIKKEDITKVENSEYKISIEKPRRLIVTNPNGANLYLYPNLNSKIIGIVDSGEKFFQSNDIYSYNNTKDYYDTEDMWFYYNGGYINHKDVESYFEYEYTGAENEYEIIFCDDAIFNGIEIPANSVIQVERYYDDVTNYANDKLYYNNNYITRVKYYDYYFPDTIVDDDYNRISVKGMLDEKKNSYRVSTLRDANINGVFVPENSELKVEGNENYKFNKETEQYEYDYSYYNVYFGYKHIKFLDNQKNKLELYDDDGKIVELDEPNNKSQVYDRKSSYKVTTLRDAYINGTFVPKDSEIKVLVYDYDNYNIDTSYFEYDHSNYFVYYGSKQLKALTYQQKELEIYDDDGKLVELDNPNSKIDEENTSVDNTVSLNNKNNVIISPMNRINYYLIGSIITFVVSTLIIILINRKKDE